MNVLLIGPKEDSPTDGVIIKGIRYLLNKAYANCQISYKELEDITVQCREEFELPINFDMIVVGGTPWLWDSFQTSQKYKNLLTAFSTYPKAKRVFMGIGSCIYFKDTESNILERPEEIAALRHLYSNATVIVRDHLAFNKLSKARVKSIFLPCPAYYCYGDEKPNVLKTGDAVLVFQDPTLSVSSGDWTNLEKLEMYFNKMKRFLADYTPVVYCATAAEMKSCQNHLRVSPVLLRNAEHTLSVMKHAHKVMSGRVYCAVPAIVQDVDTELIPLDTRSYVISDFKNKNHSQYLNAWVETLKGIFERKVGTESQRTHKKYQETGFFDKYMSGEGLDIGFAGYTEGGQPILSTAIGIDLDYPGYNGIILPFQDKTQDYVYSSHCLEHISNDTGAIMDWFRVLKEKGHLIIVVPHKYLYEKRQYLPSKWNLDHKRFYTPGTLLTGTVECALPPNSYRIRMLQDGDADFDYNKGPEVHSSGQYEIILVIQKIKAPNWNLA